MYIEGVENKDVKNLIKSIKSKGKELDDYIEAIYDKKISFSNKEKLINENIEIVIKNREMTKSNLNMNRNDNER